MVLTLGGMISPVHADTLTLGNNLKPFYVSTTPILGGYNNVLDAGGDAEGTLNGIPLAGVYCVAILNPVYLGGTYPTTTIRNDGICFGQPINNAGTISWLLANYALQSDTWDKQKALQAAIWRTEYGTDFQLDGADNANPGNNSTVTTTYQALIAASSGKTAPLGWIDWMSPNDLSGHNYDYQALVGLRQGATPAPEPASLALATLGLVGFLLRRRR